MRNAVAALEDSKSIPGNEHDTETTITDNLTFVNFDEGIEQRAMKPTRPSKKTISTGRNRAESGELQSFPTYCDAVNVTVNGWQDHVKRDVTEE